MIIATAWGIACRRVPPNHFFRTEEAAPYDEAAVQAKANSEAKTAPLPCGCGDTVKKPFKQTFGISTDTKAAEQAAYASPVEAVACADQTCSVNAPYLITPICLCSRLYCLCLW